MKNFVDKLPFIITVIVESVVSLIVLLFLRQLFVPFVIFVVIALVVLKENAWILTASILVGLGFAYLETGTVSQQLVIARLLVVGSLVELTVRFIQSRYLKSHYQPSSLGMSMLFAVIGLALWWGWMYNRCDNFAVEHPTENFLNPSPSNSIVRIYDDGTLSSAVVEYGSCISYFIFGSVYSIEGKFDSGAGQYLAEAVIRSLFAFPVVFVAVFAGLSRVLFSKFSIGGWIVQTLLATVVGGIFLYSVGLWGVLPVNIFIIESGILPRTADFMSKLVLADYVFINLGITYVLGLPGRRN